ncbi:MAG: thioredoxin fold domain-containing protein [Cyanobacteria bacterium TGS_CYA1]|nr:thioredoxin fold domain-containing protein [Cyanobacteria bacterium TGS_CYA1]
MSISSAFAHADAFSNLSYKQAKEQAQKEGKILIVDFMATWCPPCKKMEKDTWVDSKVNEWIKQNAIAIQVDVDKDAATTSELNIDSMPTIVLFRPDGGGKEFTRESGYQSPDELLQWLNGAKSGKSAEQVNKESRQTSDGSVFERVSKAHKLMVEKKYTEAHEEYLWLWKNVSNDAPVVGELRQKMIPFEVRQLLLKFPEAKGEWIALRDKAEKDNNRAEWLSLNVMLDDNKSTLAWFDKAKKDAAQSQKIIELGSYLETPLFAAQRFADAADYLYPKPIELIREYHKKAAELKNPRPDTQFAKDFDPFPPMVFTVYCAYTGAGRDAEAKKIYDECIRLDDTPTMRESLDKIRNAMEKVRTAKTGSAAK